MIVKIPKKDIHLESDNWMAASCCRWLLSAKSYRSCDSIYANNKEEYRKDVFRFHETNCSVTNPAYGLSEGLQRSGSSIENTKTLTIRAEKIKVLEIVS